MNTRYLLDDVAKPLMWMAFMVVFSPFFILISLFVFAHDFINRLRFTEAEEQTYMNKLIYPKSKPLYSSIWGNKVFGYTIYDKPSATQPEPPTKESE